MKVMTRPDQFSKTMPFNVVLGRSLTKYLSFPCSPDIFLSVYCKLEASLCVKIMKLHEDAY